MMNQRTWSTADFESMSWHDCHVHGLRVAEGQYGAGELELDLDYIVEWRRVSDRTTFLIVPARLTFHEVTNLRITIDWATPSAGLGPFSLAGVERRSEVRPRYTATIWRIAVNWPAGSIEFEAAGFTQVAWGREVESEQQVLKQSERRPG